MFTVNPLKITSYSVQQLLTVYYHSVSEFDLQTVNTYCTQKYLPYFERLLVYHMWSAITMYIYIYTYMCVCV